MANILENYLDNLADAIRLKTGGTEEIEAMDFASEIRNIPQNTTGIFQEKTVELTSSGTTEIIPDEGYDGMTKVSIAPKLQTKSQTLTNNSSTVTITPDDGYAGLSSVSVTSNIANNISYQIKSPNGDTAATYSFTIPAAAQKAFLILHAVTQADFSGISVTGSGFNSITRLNTDNLGSPYTVVNSGFRYSTFLWTIVKNDTSQSRTLSLKIDGNGLRYSCPVIVYNTK